MQESSVEELERRLNRQAVGVQRGEVSRLFVGPFEFKEAIVFQVPAAHPEQGGELQ